MAYDTLDFNSPMGDSTVQGLVATVRRAPPQDILDVGCGWAELLLRLLAVSPDATGHGVDHNEELLDRARGNALDRSLSERATFARTLQDQPPADLVLCIGSEQVFGSLTEAHPSLWALVRPGGQLVLGTLFWEQEPPAQLLADFGPLPTLNELVVDAANIGWRTVGLRTASLQDWDQFEFGFMADREQIILTTSDASVASEQTQLGDGYLEAYLQRRGVLGFATLTLARPLSST